MVKSLPPQYIFGRQNIPPKSKKKTCLLVSTKSIQYLALRASDFYLKYIWMNLFSEGVFFEGDKDLFLANK
jgi:hypothetical protein